MSSHIIVRSWFESHGSWWSWYIMSLLAMQIGSGLSWPGGRQGAAALWYNIMKLRLDSVIQDSFLMFFVYRFSSVSHLFFSQVPLLHCSTVPLFRSTSGTGDQTTFRRPRKPQSAAPPQLGAGPGEADISEIRRFERATRITEKPWKVRKYWCILFYIDLYCSILHLQYKRR